MKQGKIAMNKVRRKDRELGLHEAMELLSTSEYGVLSTVGEEMQPYGMPLSFVFKNNCIYFHCALSGRKLQNLGNNNKVSFCVVGKTKVLPDKFATEYESAIAFGVATELYGDERYSALLALLEKYTPEYIDEGKKYIEQKDAAMKVFKVEISYITGKAR